MDVGETAYASVLADDLDNDGKMDLVLSTMNGNLYCFHSTASYHPLKSWPIPVSLCTSHLPAACSLTLPSLFSSYLTFMVIPSKIQ